MTVLGSITNDPDFSATVDDDIIIDQIVSSTATIKSTGGSITINQSIDQGSVVTLDAASTITIKQKVDNKSTLYATAQGDISIEQKVDQSSLAQMTSFAGDIHIGQKIDQHSTADFVAQTIRIDQKVDQHSEAHLVAHVAIIVSQGVDGNADVFWEAPSIDCPQHDGGKLYQLPIDSIRERMESALTRMQTAKKKLRPRQRG